MEPIPLANGHVSAEIVSFPLGTFTPPSHILSGVTAFCFRNTGKQPFIWLSGWSTEHLCTSSTSSLRTGKQLRAGTTGVTVVHVTYRRKCNHFGAILCSLNLDKQTVKGSTALHYCCLTDNSECLKLLLRGKASIDIGKEARSSRGVFAEPLYFCFSQLSVTALQSYSGRDF